MFYIVPPWNSVYHVHLHVMVLPFVSAPKDAGWMSSFGTSVRRWGFSSNRYNATPWQVMEWIGEKEREFKLKAQQQAQAGPGGGGLFSKLFGRSALRLGGCESRSDEDGNHANGTGTGRSCVDAEWLTPR